MAALRASDPRYPWIGPTPDEDDAAEVLALIHAEHQGDHDEPDERGRWGRCASSGDPWPCPAWVEGEHLAVLFLGRAADRVVAHARAIPRPDQFADIRPTRPGMPREA